ncbi:solute carrier family 22 member 5-like [Melanaphis sacchari]|uniref:solute carrier family 22 member 5-like n=1 Tax=Melanaphis sacchari TaxID=742174 RepID=UPI000DC146B6|nr:solute carrier family 22 member 5-like [Melanaphis sacchari]
MNIDSVLVTVGMGRYQFAGCVLFGFMIMYSNVSPVTYIFTAGDLKYRCTIPGCDSQNPAERIYEPEWLRFTTPYRENTGLPHKCKRYSRNPANSSQCLQNVFDNNTIELCHDGWVFEDNENTIGNEFELMCEENKWKLSMVGTVNNLGQFIGIPVSGIIADKFGRKFAMVFCAVTSAIICIIQSFSVNYQMFLVLELLSSIISSGVYTVTIILAMELVLPNHRVLYYSILECFYPIGAILVAFIASLVKDWRLLLQIANIPGLLFLSYFWLMEESMRWLEMQGKHDRVINVLKRIAGINKKSLPVLPSNTQMETINYNDENDAKYVSILKDVIGSPTMLCRLIRCSLVWIAITLVYYGLTICATDIAGDKYLNFSLASFVEIPACLLNWLIMERMSRKMSLSCMFVLSGLSSVLYNSVPESLLLIKLLIFLINKLAISIAFCIIYLLTVEIFPTRMRATLLSVCSMIGRIGSMLAPQTTLLAEYFGNYVNMFVFGTTALLAAAITMTLPESKNIKLPDTVVEAEQIGIDRLLPENVENS